MTTLIGLIAAALTTISFVPQAIQVLRSKDTSGLSLVMYAMFSLGVALWTLYGVLIWSLPVIVANAITLALSLTILRAIWRGRGGPPKAGT
jgi:MtN3 and saliva related transmembrane protein